MKIYLASGNKNKKRELSQILSDFEIDERISDIEFKLDNMFDDKKYKYNCFNKNINEFRLRKLKIYKHNLYTLINYKNHRKMYDDYINLNINNYSKIRDKVD